MVLRSEHANRLMGDISDSRMDPHATDEKRTIRPPQKRNLDPTATPEKKLAVNILGDIAIHMQFMRSELTDRLYDQITSRLQFMKVNSPATSWTDSRSACNS